MTSPNVGKVTLDAAINGDDLRSQLTREIQKEVMPQLRELNKEIGSLTSEIGKVQSRPFEDIAKSAGVASDEIEKVGAATRQAERAETSYREQVLRTRDAIKRRAAVASKARQEERENGAVSLATEKALERASEQAAIAIQRRTTKQAEWESRLARIEDARHEARKKHAKEVDRFRMDEIEGYQDLIRNANQAADSIIADAVRRTNKEIEEARRAMEAAERNQKRLTEITDRESKKREKIADRERRRKEREDDKNRFINQVASAGRTLGAVRHVAAPVGLGVAGGVAAQLATVAANASQSLIALPAIIGAVVAGTGTLKLSLLGLGDAFSALMSADKDPMAYAEAIGALSPAMARAVNGMRDVPKMLYDIRDATQAAFFAAGPSGQGFGDQVESLTGTFAPVIEHLTTSIADSFNAMWNRILNTMTGPEFRDNIETFVGYTELAFQRLEPAITPVIEAIGKLLAVGGTALPGLTTALTEGANAFGKFIDEASKSGELESWMNSGLAAVREITGWVGHLVDAWFRLAPVGESLLPGLSAMIHSLIELTVSAIQVTDSLGTSGEGLAVILGSISGALKAINFVAAFGPGEIAIGKLMNPLNQLHALLEGIVSLINRIAGTKFNSVLGIPIPGAVPQTTADLAGSAQAQLDAKLAEIRAGGLGGGPGISNLMPPITGPATLPKGPWETLSPADKWLVADAANGDPNLQTRENGLLPGQYRRRDGSIGGAPRPNGPDYTRPEDLTAAAAESTSKSDIKKEIEESLNPADFAVDPWAAVGAPNVLPNGAMSVNIQNLPAGGMVTMPGTAIGGTRTTPLNAPDGGLKPNAAALNDIIGQMFPQIAQIGGYRADGGGSNDHPSGSALDIMIPGWDTPEGKALGDTIWKFLNENADSLGVDSTIWQDYWSQTSNPAGGHQLGRQGANEGHYNHIHAKVRDAMASGGGLIAPTMSGADLYKSQTPMLDGSMQTVDQQALMRAAQSVEGAGRDLQKASYDLAVATKMHERNLITDQDLLEAQNKELEAREKLTQEQLDYAETAQGKNSAVDYDKLPFGDPRKILAAAIGGAGGSPEDIAALVGPIFGSVGAPMGQAAGGAATSALNALSPNYRKAPAADYSMLAQQRNPLTPFAMAGLDVPDYTIAGGGPEAQNLLTNTGPPVQADGRMFSETSALLDRSFTSLRGALEAKIDQLKAVMDGVQTKLSEQVVGPVVENAVRGALEGAGEALGTAIGNTAGPIIANAVASAMPSQSPTSAPGGLVQTGVGIINNAGGAVVAPVPRAAGGPVYGGIPGVDSVPILAQRNEYVLDTSDVAMMGGVQGVDRWRRGLKAGRIKGFATGGGVIGNDTVGADFFGVSQIPIIGMIVNLLVRVLLKVLGIEIEVRDTLDEMAGEFRTFRGEAWEAFTATGRLMNDTSALLDRSQSSEQAAADERLRILKIVIEGLIKFVIEKLIVPIGKAVANSLIQAGAGAASGAIGASFPGGSIVGGAVGSMISAMGSAGVDIVAEIFTEFSLALTSVLTDMIGELLQGLLPDLMTNLLGGNLLAMLADPISALFGGILGPVMGIFTGLLGGLGGILPSFDEGGVGSGLGFMPKATIEPERVLSPRQTANHERLTDLLDSGVLSRLGSRTTTIHAAITVPGGPEAGQNVYDRLTRLMD